MGKAILTMTINEVVKAMSAAHMQYGQYVKQYDPPALPPQSPKPTRACKRCGCDLSGRGKQAQYCFECSDIQRHEAIALRKQEQLQGVGRKGCV